MGEARVSCYTFVFAKSFPTLVRKPFWHGYICITRKYKMMNEEFTPGPGGSPFTHRVHNKNSRASSPSLSPTKTIYPFQAWYTVRAPHTSPLCKRHIPLHSSLPEQSTYRDGSTATPALAPLAGIFNPALVSSSGTSIPSPV